MDARRIDLSLLDDEIKSLISASTKIMPVEENVIINNTPLDGIEYCIVVTNNSEYRNNIYKWNRHTFEWELIGADDKSVTWEEVNGKPLVYPPSTHEHSQYALVSHEHPHNHDTRYYTIAQMDLIVSNHEHIQYAPITVVPTITNHEERITRIESGYSDGHFHGNIPVLDELSDIGGELNYKGKTISTDIDLSPYATKVELATKSDINHTHPDYATKTELSGKADTSTVSGHTGNSTVHVTQSDKDNWNKRFANGVYIDDTRNINSPPSYYYNRERHVEYEFKTLSSIGIAGGGFCTLETITPWGDASGGSVIQNAYSYDTDLTRHSISDTTWSEWYSTDSHISVGEPSHKPNVWYKQI